MKRRLFILLFGSLLIVACGDGSLNKNAKNDRISGIVEDRSGPVSRGKLEVTDTNGNILVSTELKGKDRYAVTIPAMAKYPIVLKVITGDGKVLEAVAMDATSEKQDITVMSTLVVKSARDLGGISQQNMAQAAINAIRQNRKKSGKGTSTGFKGDPTKQYGGWH